MAQTLKEKKNEAEERGIHIPDTICGDKNIVGIYEFFKVKDDEKYCFYVGKSTDVAYRLLGSSSGHIYMYLHNNFSKLVPLKINQYLNEGYEIEVEIIEIDYNDISFSKAAHRLALAELKEIVNFQELGQCEFQVPEGVGTNEEKFWEEYYKKSDTK